MKRIALSLSKKASLSIIIIILPILITFLITYRLNRDYLKRLALDDMTVIAEAYEGQIYQFLEMGKRRALDFSSDGFIRDSLERIIKGDTSQIRELNNYLIKNKMPLDSSIHEIYVISPDGRMVSSTDPSEIGMDLSNEPFFINGKNGISVIEHISGHEGIPEIMISTPVYSRDSEMPIGVLVNFVHLSELNDVLSGEFNRRLGAISWSKGRRKTMEAYLVNRDRLMITGSRFIKGAALNQRVDMLPVEVCLESGSEMSAFYRNYRGVEVAGASMCIPDMKWTLLVEIDKEEILSSVRAMQKGLVISAGFATILFIMLLIMFLRYVVKPLNGVSSAAKEISRGNFDIAVPVKVSDEIGILSESFNSMARELGEKTAELKKLSTAIEQSVNIIFITDREGNIEYVNPMFERVTGWSKEDAIGKNSRILSSGETPEALYKELWETITSGLTWRGVLKNRKKNGEYYWCNSLIFPLQNGQITHFLSIEEDITEKKNIEARMQFLDYYDPMTGLANRAKFMDLMEIWIAGAKIPDSTGALLLLDIDDFKLINDTYGHGTGDELLHRIARLFDDIVRDKVDVMKNGEGVVSRLGGDEFALFLPYAKAVDAMGMAEEIRRRIENLTIAVDVSIRTTVSIGLSLYPEHGSTRGELITRADAAMYRAKDMGKNRCHLYRPEDMDLEKMHSRLKEKAMIQKAIEEDRFEPWFQPILDLKDNKIHHCEALARMKDEKGNILLPGSFIDTAERFGLIGAIDRIIAEKVIKLQAEMNRNGVAISFGMNLSGKNLGDEELLSFLKSRITEAGARPDHLTFEITETAAVRDMDRAIRFIKALKEIGCLFSLDDFGVGFTSFVYLREMGVDCIKIDGSFIRRLDENPQDQLFVRAMADVAKGMRIKTVAEFAEGEGVIRLLKKFGVDYAQGYFIGKPAPWAEIKNKIEL